jgi:hypothetical protein
MAIPKFNVAQSLAFILDALLKLQASYYKLDQQIDEIKKEVEILKAYVDKFGATSPPTTKTEPAVAFQLHFVLLPDGSAKVSIDGGEWIALPPRRAELLEFLKSGDRDPEDKLVAWRSIEEIKAFLEHRHQKPFRRSYINDLIYDLRKALEGDDPKQPKYNPNLVQTHREKGARLALIWRPGPPPPGPDEQSFRAEPQRRSRPLVRQHSGG